jgi:hypothetical protein
MAVWAIDHSAFALFVHAWRTERRALSLRAAAAETGLSYATLCRAERMQPVSAGSVLRLCLWMDANPFWFLTDPSTGRRIASPPEVPVSRETSGETP